jgi:hypothetical protein
MAEAKAEPLIAKESIILIEVIYCERKKVLKEFQI